MKALGSVYDRSEVKPLKKAVDIARKTGLKPEFVETLLREGDGISGACEEGLMEAVENRPHIFVTVRDGTLRADSGVNFLNLPPNKCAVPSPNPDETLGNSADIKRSTDGARG